MRTAQKTREAADKNRASVAIDRRRSVPPQVYEVLREKILTVQLKPGESINERWLADWLGVSRTPIREAINRLSANGLIAIVPNVGTSVSLINVARVKEFNLIRTSLELMIVRHAAERFDEVSGRALSDLIDRQIATLQGPDLIENIVVDTDFITRSPRSAALRRHGRSFNASWTKSCACATCRRAYSRPCES